MKKQNSQHETLAEVKATRLAGCGDNLQCIDESCDIVTEAAILIDVADVGSYTVMAMPQQQRELAVGFLVADGIIDDINDIMMLNHCPDDANIIRIQLANKPVEKTNRNLVVTSSCGLCGNMAIDKLLESLAPVDDKLIIDNCAIFRAQKSMHNQQQIFAKTGGTHAAAIFDAAGDVIAFAEDIGRHNALDKAIGQCFLQGKKLAGHGVALSGRVSLEMAIKCARAGIELIAAISAPTTLAVDASIKSNITLCAYVRKDRLTVFTNPHRITSTQPKLA
jgi:FdhD protein